ncbi:MAG: F0F1 ATP synthase subunit B [Bacteroidales bacterium]|nr:F0F1 ATP synthase subunit B [Bacteroidales bacterium]MBR2857567.1 F0F1 ATP synthase subunit B [Bacteroidales bacterium]
MNLLLPESGLLFWMTVIFAIVFFVLAKFGFPVITGMVERRSRRINDSLEAARVAEEAIENLNATKEQIVAETRMEQERLTKEAVGERERIIGLAQAQARQEADRILQEAREKILEEKEAALKDIRREVALVSMTIAEKLVRKELSSAEGQRELLDRLVEDMTEHKDMEVS